MNNHPRLLSLLLSFLLLGTAAAYDVGDRVAFEAQDSDGRTHRLADYPDKVVVLVFWGSNCKFSKDYSKRLEALKAKFAGQDVVFLAVASNSSETAATVRAGKSAHGFSWSVLLDANHSLKDSFGAEVTPEAYVVGPDGTLRYHGRIDDDPMGRKSDAQPLLEQAILATQSGGSPPASHTARGVQIR